MGFLIDTNVVSEMARPAPDPAVLGFLRREADLWLSVITLHEIAYGIARLPDTPRRDGLFAWLESVKTGFEHRVLDVTPAVAHRAAAMRAASEAKGRVSEPLDALIAATAVTQGLILATRNIRDFEALGVPLEDPWRR